MSYIVKNCPCLFNSYYASGKTVRFECNDGNHDDKLCRDVTDCVMKQVIQECRKSIKCFESNEIACPVCSDAASAELTQDILQLFDIEEINK